MKYAYLPATTRLPPTLSERGQVVVRARRWRDGRDRPYPLPRRARNRRDRQGPPPRPDDLGDRDRRRRTGAARLERGAAPGRRPGVAGRRGRPARRALRRASVARARVLRPPADRPADVARHRGPAGGPLLPRLR